ncbi:MAG: DUF3619 family protein [Proteobacteria bacterium]|nr:DUF3619 family protein [Pseudomonadota bacterium]
MPVPATLEALETRFGLTVAARLSERTGDMAPDLSERLRFARERALARAQEVRRAEVAAAAPAPQVVSRRGGAAGLAFGGGWWFKVAAVLPMLALAAGLVVIQQWQARAEIDDAAEIDAALLSDDLPPSAYSDTGFVEFLKTPPRE